MHDDLFFIPLIAAAMDEPDRQKALRAAFERIRGLGQQHRHRRGYRQFLHWMQNAARVRNDREANLAHRPARATLDRPTWLELVIEQGDTRLAALRVAPGETSIIRCLAPGPYRFSLDTGCVLWEGSISAQGVFVSRPQPGRPLRMAAATTEPAARCQQLSLLEGAMVLCLRFDGPVWLLEIEFLRQEG
jgi:hypothetical protein